MFTGIVQEVGQVRALVREDQRARLEVACRAVVADASIGDSINVAGCCLTVTELPGDGFTAELMDETLRVTALGDLIVGSRVNLEAAMRADGRFGGHLVQGHVDGVGVVLDRRERPGSVILTIQLPEPLGRYVVDKGSVTVDGISLTVIDVGPRQPGGEMFRVGLIPHTLDATTIGERDVGDRVNLEVDVVAKYVERLVQAGTATPYQPDRVEKGTHVERAIDDGRGGAGDQDAADGGTMEDPTDPTGTKPPSRGPTGPSVSQHP